MPFSVKGKPLEMISLSFHLRTVYFLRLHLGKTLSIPVYKGDLILKNICLQFSFWAHMLLSWVSVIIVDVGLAYVPVRHGYMKNHIYGYGF